jgi:hypothetical protein
VGWHWLRHANATLLDAVGTPLGTVQALLGHSSAEITRVVYLHSIPSDARAAVQKVEDLLIGPSTPVHLFLAETLSSKTAQTGATVKLHVLGDVKVGDLVVIAIKRRQSEGSKPHKMRGEAGVLGGLS